MGPQEYIWRHLVSESDIDALGHASNLAYVRWVQDAAIAHSEHVGFDQAAYVKMGGIFVIRRHEVDYLRSAMLGDQLEVRTRVSEAMAAKCHRQTEITRVSGGEPMLLARALTVWGFLDVDTGRPSRIPDRVRAAFGMPARARRWDGPREQSV